MLLNTIARESLIRLNTPVIYYQKAQQQQHQQSKNNNSKQKRKEKNKTKTDVSIVRVGQLFSDIVQR